MDIKDIKDRLDTIKANVEAAQAALDAGDSTSACNALGYVIRSAAEVRADITDGTTIGSYYAKLVPLCQ